MEWRAISFLLPVQNFQCRSCFCYKIGLSCQVLRGPFYLLFSGLKSCRNLIFKNWWCFSSMFQLKIGPIKSLRWCFQEHTCGTVCSTILPDTLLAEWDLLTLTHTLRFAHFFPPFLFFLEWGFCCSVCVRKWFKYSAMYHPLYRLYFLSNYLYIYCILTE